MSQVLGCLASLLIALACIFLAGALFGVIGNVFQAGLHLFG